MLFAPPFGLLAHGRAVSKDMSAFADQCIIYCAGNIVKNIFAKNPTFLLRNRIFSAFFGKIGAKGRVEMKEEEKKTNTWEVSDPKAPVIRSGRMENRRQH